jgi:hypothetical protein
MPSTERVQFISRRRNFVHEGWMDSKTVSTRTENRGRNFVHSSWVLHSNQLLPFKQDRKQSRSRGNAHKNPMRCPKVSQVNFAFGEENVLQLDVRMQYPMLREMPQGHQHGDNEQAAAFPFRQCTAALRQHLCQIAFCTHRRPLRVRTCPKHHPNHNESEACNVGRSV